MLEAGCSQSGWFCERIPEESTRTPDYRITIYGTRLYAEVKEIIANEEERKIIRQLSESGCSDAYGEEPGKTIREKIKESYAQIKGLAKVQKCPGILVLYNNSGMDGLGRISSYNVLTGMFGLQTVRVTIPRDPSIDPIFGPDYFGPKKSVTRDRNRYLSGIMTLFEHYERGLMMLFYHNPHAKYPINPRLIDAKNCLQYRLSSTELNWELIDCPDT